MTEDKFHELQKRESDTLRACFHKETSFLEACEAITINHGEGFSIYIFQNAFRTIEIRSSKTTEAQQLWEILYSIVRLCMLFDGEFLQMASVEFCMNNEKADWSNLLTQGYRERILPYYSSADFMADSNFACPLCCLSDAAVNKWTEIEAELQLVQPMALYAMSGVKMPIDLKAAILIETFEPLFELAKSRNPRVKMAPAQQKKNGERDSGLRRMLEGVIKEYGADIFPNEYKKGIYKFTERLTHSRNRIFHINKGKHNFLDSAESVLYAVKLSMLYRKVLMDILGVNSKAYLENLKSAVNKWDAWYFLRASLIS